MDKKINETSTLEEQIDYWYSAYQEEFNLNLELIHDKNKLLDRLDNVCSNYKHKLDKINEYIETHLEISVSRAGRDDIQKIINEE